MLFDTKFDNERVTVIPIVGFGGLGKTTLAQLVVNNESVKQHFDLTKWAYVPEKDNLIAIMGKIFKSTDKDYNNFSLDQIKRGIRESIEAKKYLLLVSRLQYLRVLSIMSSSITELPNSIGELIHLRYLEIGCKRIEYLPGSITRLESLQTLHVIDCRELKELPSDLAKLTSLRHLLIPISFNEVFELPSGIGKMTSLQVLNSFIAGKNNGIDALPFLKLTGRLIIIFREWRKDAIVEAQKANLKNSDLLTDLDFQFKVTPPSDEMNEMLMHLQLPPNLRQLCIWEYSGGEMPSRWFDELSKLVTVEFIDCPKLKILPTSLLSLTSLQTLKGIISDLTIKVLAALGIAALKKAASWWNARDELHELEKTMRLIQARVHDAEMRQEAESGKAIKECFGG
ncbi:putative disease resistance protein RGA4 [Bienertia sinuspersici]